MNFIVDPTIHMWVSLILTGVAIFLFAREKLPLEVTSITILTILLIFGQIFPLEDANGRNQLDAVALFSGFANPSLIAVLALLVMGQGIIQTDALSGFTRFFIPQSKSLAGITLVLLLVFVMVMSAFMNNTPLVVLAIPIMQTLAVSMGVSESRIMMPLSFAAILGGMTTLVGSSTNLLVSSTMQELGYDPLGFFDFVVPGAMLAAVGFLYVLIVAPFLLPDRSRMAQDLLEDEKEFVAEIDVDEDSPLAGMKFEDGRIPALPDVKVKLAQRAGQLSLPPFQDYEIRAGDILIVSATRNTLMEILSKYPGFLLTDDKIKNDDSKPSRKATTSQRQERREEADHYKEDLEETRGKDVRKDSKKDKEAEEEDEEKIERHGILAEVMISPGSRLIDMSLDQAGLERQYGGIVLGIQRRARVVRRRLGRIRLEAGDVLLIACNYNNIQALRASQDLIVLSGSKREVPRTKKAPLAISIFLGVIGLAAFGLISIPVAAFSGAVLMIATDCLNIRQATRAIDRKIFLLVGSMLALGTVLQATGGAQFLATSIMQLPLADKPLFLSAILFIMVAITTNILTNNACAILFTPIALNMAINSGIDTFFFAITVVLAANCSFASPIGYQTNLLVMGPGHYRFRDFMKAGVPLMLLLWLAYIVIAYFYFGIGLS